MQPARLSLVVVPPAPLTAPGSALAYVRGAMVSPICISAVVFASCIGAGVLGVVGALGAFLAVSILIAASTRYPVVRRHLDHEAAARLRCAREARRVGKLRSTGPVRLHQYFELRGLVAETEKRDAREANRFELQELLEHFVSLASHHQQCLDALRVGGSYDLPFAIPIDPTRSKRRREIQARRLRHRDACIARIERIADELEAVDELIRLVAQRVACPIDDLETIDREIDRRLGELDEIDDALQQLSA
jgi:hypothetical protein